MIHVQLKGERASINKGKDIMDDLHEMLISIKEENKLTQANLCISIQFCHGEQENTNKV